MQAKSTLIIFLTKKNLDVKPQKRIPVKEEGTLSPYTTSVKPSVENDDSPVYLSGCRSVDEFKKLNLIDEGTYGVVYRAQDLKSGEIVALKRLKLDREKEGFPITSLREIQTLLLCKHPHIVNLKEIVVGNTTDSIFMVFEFVEHDLKALMDDMKSPFLQSEVKTLMIQLLSAVASMHSNWTIHRDLKTSNLLMNNRGELKVADFGLARHFGSPVGRMTQMVVTLWYRAPELLLGSDEYTTMVDMWSVGCIFAEFVNKEPLVPGVSEIDQLDKIFKLLGMPNDKIWPGYSQLPHASKIRPVNQPYNNLKAKFPYMTENGRDLLQRMLTYDPKQRITAEEALRHPYFKENPPAKDPSLFPSWPSKGSAERRKRDSPNAPLGRVDDDDLTLDQKQTMHSLSQAQMQAGATQNLGFRLRF
ncbi:Pkinase-domain-containing protein [Rozella allomycis CSF55]|uniref:cyclin-dependent kinase n=1 Tax=Rozella allomycis (strain CSF55) TaxID=988480 RepID=A0A4P9YDJ9_ROZAC|nr:Pkinase-domain-containing protein [Rozella allomycis CSF55]